MSACCLVSRFILRTSAADALDSHYCQPGCRRRFPSPKKPRSTVETLSPIGTTWQPAHARTYHAPCPVATILNHTLSDTEERVMRYKAYSKYAFI